MTPRTGPTDSAYLGGSTNAFRRFVSQGPRVTTLRLGLSPAPPSAFRVVTPWQLPPLWGPFPRTERLAASRAQRSLAVPRDREEEGKPELTPQTALPRHHRLALPRNRGGDLSTPQPPV